MKRNAQKASRLAHACIRHSIEHCAENRQPVGLCLGYAVGLAAELREAADALGLPVSICADPMCVEPCHVTLLTEPMDDQATR